MTKKGANALRFGIFGSCVTRDAFELSGEPRGEWTIAVYLARTTINSSLSPAPPIDRIAPTVERRPFEERCVAIDLLKLQFDTLAQHEFDYLLVDLIDERHSILVSGETCLCYSVPFVRTAQAHGIDTSRFERRGALDPRVVEATLSNIPRFMRRLGTIVPPERTILHEALWSECFLDGEEKVVQFPNRDEIHAINEVLSTYYARIEADSAAIRTIRPRPEYRLGDAGHKWSLEPFHYTTAYYRDFMRQLGDIVASDRTLRATSAA
jgi:hypothetical protein